VAKEPIDLRRYRMRLPHSSPQTVPMASNFAILGSLEKPLQEIDNIMLTKAELCSHSVPPLRYDGLRRGTTHCAIQHLIVSLLQVA